MFRLFLRIVILSGLLNLPAEASRWHFNVDFDLLTDYTGNVFLEAEHQQSELVIRARPVFSGSREGGRGSASFTYTPEFRYFTQGTQSSRVVHFFSGDADIELIERFLGIRMQATAGENVIDTNFGFANDGITNPENVTENRTITISPYLLPVRFGRYAELGVDVDLDLVAYSDSELEDSRSRSVNVALTSGPYFSPFNWSLNLEKSLVDYRDSGDKNEDNLFGSLGYRINRVWSIFGLYGVDFLDSGSSTVLDDKRWSVGLEWTPHSRAGLTVGLGERFGETDYLFQFSYKHKTSCWYSDYRHEISSARNDLLNGNSFSPNGQLCSASGDIIQGSGAELGLSIGPSISTGEFITDSFRLGFNWILHRTTLDIVAQYDKRDYFETNGAGEDWGLALRASRKLTPRSHLGFNALLMEHSEEMSADLDYQQYSAALNYTYNMTRTTNLVFGYRFTIRKNESVEDYSEDRLTFSLVSNYD